MKRRFRPFESDELGQKMYLITRCVCASLASSINSPGTARGVPWLGRRNLRRMLTRENENVFEFH